MRLVVLSEWGVIKGFTCKLKKLEDDYDYYYFWFVYSLCYIDKIWLTEDKILKREASMV